jgi:hypothetical protein
MELLVRIVDRPGGLSKGDLVVDRPDGHPWSEAERTNPQWRILAVPGLSVTDVTPLRERRPGQTPGVIAGRRSRYLDLDTLAAPGNRPTIAALRAAVRTRTS